MGARDVGEMEVMVGEGFSEGFLESGRFVTEEEGGLGEAVEHEDFEGGWGRWGRGG